MYKDAFKKYVNQGINEYYIGSGNPNAAILFIGKESRISATETDRLRQYLNNAKEWRIHLENNTCETLEYPVEVNHVLRKDWGKNTWSKYQMLSDHIWEKSSEKYKVDFLKSTFTTEINDSPETNTSTANKSGLNKRKNLFKESEFIQSFPVVVLACSNYIRNKDKDRELDRIFNVTYDGDESGKYLYSKGNWFFVHHNKDKTKLVIHTRQLSANVDSVLLKEMGKVIRCHLFETGIIKK